MFHAAAVLEFVELAADVSCAAMLAAIEHFVQTHRQICLVVSERE